MQPATRDEEIDPDLLPLRPRKFELQIHMEEEASILSLACQTDPQYLPLNEPLGFTKAGEAFHRMLLRPNIHIGIHYQEDIEEYASTWNSAVLTGEDYYK